MKIIHTILVVLACCNVGLAQNKHNLFVDAGITKLGISATYDRKLTKGFEVGLGVNAHSSRYEPYGKPRVALYVDARPYWQINKSMLFVFANIGTVYYTAKAPDSTWLKPLDFYCALGGGYHYSINKRGMGPYASLGMYCQKVTVHYSFANLPEKAKDYWIVDASLMFSVGIKF